MDPSACRLLTWPLNTTSSGLCVLNAILLQEPFSPLHTKRCQLAKSFLWFTVSYTAMGASLVALRLRIRLQCRRLRFNPWVRKIPCRRAWQPTPVLLPTEAPGGLQSTVSQRVRHNYSNRAHTHACTAIDEAMRSTSMCRSSLSLKDCRKMGSGPSSSEYGSSSSPIRQSCPKGKH